MSIFPRPGRRVRAPRPWPTRGRVPGRGCAPQRQHRAVRRAVLSSRQRGRDAGLLLCWCRAPRRASGEQHAGDPIDHREHGDPAGNTVRAQRQRDRCRRRSAHLFLGAVRLGRVTPAQRCRVRGQRGRGALPRLCTPATSSPRMLPQISDVLSGVPTPGERLPTVTGVTRRFRVIVRDHHAGAGGVAISPFVDLTIPTGTSQFRVVSPTGAGSSSRPGRRA